MKGSERKKREQYLLVRNLPFLYTSGNCTLPSTASYPRKEKEASPRLTVDSSGSSMLSFVPAERPTVAGLLSGILFCMCMVNVHMCVRRMEEESGILSLCTYAPDRFLRDLESGWPLPSPGSPLASAPYGTGDLGLAMLGFFCGCLGLNSISHDCAQ